MGLPPNVRYGDCILRFDVIVCMSVFLALNEMYHFFHNTEFKQILSLSFYNNFWMVVMFYIDVVKIGKCRQQEAKHRWSLCLMSH